MSDEEINVTLELIHKLTAALQAGNALPSQNMGAVCGVMANLALCYNVRRDAWEEFAQQAKDTILRYLESYENAPDTGSSDEAG